MARVEAATERQLSKKRIREGRASMIMMDGGRYGTNYNVLGVGAAWNVYDGGIANTQRRVD